MGNIIAGIFILFLSIFFTYITFTFSHTNAYGYENFANTFWPRIILGLLIFMSLIKVFTGFTDYLKEPEQEKSDKPEKYYLFVILTLIIAYILVINFIGFIISTLLFLLASFYLLGMRKKLILMLVPLSITIFVTILFVGLLYIPFPKGVGFFETITLKLYELVYLLT